MGNVGRKTSDIGGTTFSYLKREARQKPKKNSPSVGKAHKFPSFVLIAIGLRTTYFTGRLLIS